MVVEGKLKAFEAPHDAVRPERRVGVIDTLMILDRPIPDTELVAPLLGRFDTNQYSMRGVVSVP